MYKLDGKAFMVVEIEYRLDRCCPLEIPRIVFKNYETANKWATENLKHYYITDIEYNEQGK